MADALQDLTDAELLALEESLYDDEVEGIDTWERRDLILWEMNRRGLCSGNAGKTHG